MKEHSYYDYLPRIMQYIRALQLSNDTLALYVGILLEYNRNYYKPVAIPEITLQRYVGCSHKSFIKYRKQLLTHRLITVKSDGVTAAIYTIKLAPPVSIEHTAPQPNTRYLISDTYQSNQLLLREQKALDAYVEQVLQREQALKVAENNIATREQALSAIQQRVEDAELKKFIAEYQARKKRNDQ